MILATTTPAAQRAHALARTRARVLEVTEAELVAELAVLVAGDLDALDVGVRTFRARRAALRRRMAHA